MKNRKECIWKMYTRTWITPFHYRSILRHAEMLSDRIATGDGYQSCHTYHSLFSIHSVKQQQTAVTPTLICE